MKVYEVPLIFAEHDSEIIIKAQIRNHSVICNQDCAYSLLRYQVSVYRTIGPLVAMLSFMEPLVVELVTILGGLSLTSNCRVQWGMSMLEVGG